MHNYIIEDVTPAENGFKLYYREECCRIVHSMHYSKDKLQYFNRDSQHIIQERITTFIKNGNNISDTQSFFANLLSGVNDFKLLWLFMMIYVIVILLANWFNPRIVEFFGISTDAGTIIFPLTFLISDIITEVYGYKYARKSIWFGFLFSIFFFAYGFLVKESGSPAFAADQNAMFDQVVSLNMLFIISGFISYWIAEPMNSFIMAKLKILMKGKFMAGRFVGSTFVAAFLDSFIFSHIALITLFSYNDLWSLLIVMWLVKVGIELIGLSFSIPLTKKIKQFEQMDRYDLNTNFIFFTTETNYSADTNKYNNKKEKSCILL